MQTIFLLSFPRSGSTLLQCILATHPRIRTVPEDMQCFRAMQSTQFDPDAWLERRVPQQVRAKPDLSWLEKDAMLYRCPELVVQHFPEANLIWLLRDPKDAIASWYSGSSKKLKIETLIDRWQAWRRNPALKQGYQIQYENLIANPRGEVERLQDWLGIEQQCQFCNFNRDLALKAHVPHPEVLGEIKARPSKLTELPPKIRERLADLDRNPDRRVSR